MREIWITGVLLATLTVAAQAQANEPRDAHYFLRLANEAQLVMLEEQRLIPREEAQQIARGLREIAVEQDKPGAVRSLNYLDVEADLVSRVGPFASKLHMGRSRNDLSAAVLRLQLRDRVLASLDALSETQRSLLTFASHHIHTIYPAYTHAVQAQPISLAHYVLALSSALERDAQRLREAYARLDQSPLGAGALGTSGFPLDRERLRELAGFSSLLENSYDAICVAEADNKIEIASVFALSSLAIGRFTQDLVNQYGDPNPGLYFPDAMTGHSSMMPQKRNPPLDALRLTATTVLAQAQQSLLMAHNTPFYEVGDVRKALAQQVLSVTDEAIRMYQGLKTVFDGIQVNADRTLQKVNSDFSTMTELADTLLREAGVPFRIGYNFASDVTTYGRQHGKTPAQITVAEYKRLYREATGQPLPLNEQQLHQAIDPKWIVAHRRGRGGPQPAEVERMIREHQRLVDGNEKWVKSERTRIATAEGNLNAAFMRLIGS